MSTTLYRSEFTGFDRDEYLRSTWDNRIIVSFTGGYKFKRNWEISARTRYLGKTPIAPVDEEATLASYPVIVKDYSRQGELLLDPFFQTDIRLDKKWNFKGFTLNVFFELQNAFGQDTPQEPLYGLVRDDNGNEVDPRMLMEIDNIETDQILPTLGIVIDF